MNNHDKDKEMMADIVNEFTRQEIYSPEEYKKILEDMKENEDFAKLGF